MSSRVTDASKREMLLGLDEAQARAVTSPAPLLAIIAGAGSGKTSVLTRRVAWRCAQGTTDPLHTTVITFTRQAAGELRRRLRGLGLQDSVTTGTFHAVSLSLLTQFWDRIDRSPPQVVQDRRRLIGEVLGPRRNASIDHLDADINWARARNISPRSYAGAVQAANRQSLAPADEVARVMADVHELKMKRGIIDLDDLLSHLIDAMTRDSGFADIVRWRIRHLYVDEAQDMNPLQRLVLDSWRADHDDLTLVGDPSQSIYGFNGADSTVLSRLEEHFPGIEVIRLNTNYRCTPQIVRAGLSTLSHTDDPAPLLTSARPDGDAIRIHSFESEEAEAQGISRILSHLQGSGDPWSRFAVLARTNAQLKSIKDALTTSSIPIRTINAKLDDPLQRCIREVGDLPSRTRLAAWARDASTEVPDDEALDGDQGVEMIHARRRVAAVIDEFLADGGMDGRSFLGWVRAHRPFDDGIETFGVELATFHAAKGREWDTVILAGCEVGFMPHSSAKSTEAKNEEIRLAYVAMTRAADRLVLTYCNTRRHHRRTRSPFLDGLDAMDPVVPPTTEFLEGLQGRRSTRPLRDPVIDELEQWRSKVSHTASLDARLICPDDVLDTLAAQCPRDLAELESIPGLGAPLARRAGPMILEAIERGLTRRGDLPRPADPD